MAIVREFSVSSGKRTEFIDITAQVSRIVTESGVREGVCVVFTPHTTAAVTINENADPAVLHDLRISLDKLIPWNAPDYRHMEGNSAAHLKSSLFGCSLTIIVSGGKLLLGTWQGIYFCEFDGARHRKVITRVY